MLPQEARNQLRSARVIAGLSQTALARLTKMSQPVISRIETGARSASAQERDGIAVALGQTVNFLFPADDEDDE
jgi:transcriptional regulator with XRE-family HTH domain